MWYTLFQIGLMRSGKLLAEESPQVLLSMYGCQSLEEVFLKLSRKQGSNCNVTELNISNNVSLVGFSPQYAACPNQKCVRRTVLS
jgi:hypothetical protein